MSNIMSKFHFGSNHKSSNMSDEKKNEKINKKMNIYEELNVKEGNKIKKQCDKCQGIGLIKRIKEFICNNCKKEKILRCYLCENVQRGPYIECDSCFGTGEVFIERENKITNYTICRAISL